MGSVIFVNRYFYPDHSATSQFLSDLAFYIADQGIDVCVVTSHHLYDDPAARLKKTECVKGVRIRRVYTSGFGRQALVGRALDYFTFYISSFLQLYREAGKGGSIIVAKTDPPLISIVSALVAKLRGVQQINWVQDLFPEVAAALGVKGVIAVSPLLKWLRNHSLRIASTNIVLGQLPAEKLVDMGIDRARIEIIPNWTDGLEVRPVCREANKLREAWKLSERFVVGYSGNLGRAHEFSTIIDAAERLADRQDIVFLFIGGGSQRDWVEEEAKGRKLENILFKPYQPRERLTESLSVADVHLISLIPALEGCIVPSKFYGIAAAGRPTIYIGDSNGEIPRIMKIENCGYTVPIGDGERLAKLIRALSTDPGEVLKVGENARRLLESRYDKSIAMGKWRELFDRYQSTDRGQVVKDSDNAW